MDGSSGAAAPLLAMRGIHKRFPGVHALRGVDLEVSRGEVHALVGENGAGKSTLMHILAGLFPPDEGSLELDGQSIGSIESEHAARELGIAIVFQERSLFRPLTVAENIFAGREPVGRWGILDRRELRRRAGDLLEALELEVDPASPLEDLSPAEEQMVEIAKALSLRARLIIFDEPTAALSEHETEVLFRTIRGLKLREVGVIYISHRLEEIFRIADRVTVLKDGEGQGTFPASNVEPGELIRLMVGREPLPLQAESAGGSAGSDARSVVLEVRDLRDPEGRRGRAVLRGVSLQARAGEVLVLAGLTGSGRTELALSIFGARSSAGGEVLLDGRRLALRSPADAIRAGIGYLSEDRKESGLFLEMSISSNIAAARLEEFGSLWLDDRRIGAAASEFREKLRIASRGVDQEVRTLSGGNQQKVLLARWLRIRPRVLIVDEPTRGVDVGAKGEIHRLLRALAREGTAVIAISSDLPEVLALADRILILREGRVSGELAASEASEEEVLRLATLPLGR
jgi:ABC-type sugar transport system ATPase subunit